MTPEDGSVSTSYENAFNIALMHGPIVAVSHIITPRDEHITKLFYFDGKSHTAFGFRIGLQDDDDNHYAQSLALLKVIQTIWGFNPEMEQFLEQKTVLDDEKNVVYHFTASDKTALRSVLDSDGMIAFTESVEILEEEQNIVRIIE